MFPIADNLAFVPIGRKDFGHPGGRPLQPNGIFRQLQYFVVPQLDFRIGGRQTHGNNGITRAVEFPYGGNHGWQRRLDNLMSPFQLAAHLNPALLQIDIQDFVDQRQLSVPEAGGNARTGLGGIAVV